MQSTDGIAAVTANGNRYDLIYADPARRDANAHRVFSVSDCTPDIAAAKERLLQCSPRLLVKLSPMLDITSTLRLLPETSQVHAVAVRGEIKELLFLLERGYHDLPCISAVDLRGADKPVRSFSARYSQCEKPPIAPADQYVYDPSATLRKTGLADAYCAGLGLGKLHPQTMLYTASRRVEDFQGRVFRTIGTVDKKNIIERFPDRRAAVVVRNYPGTAAEIARKYKLATSDRHFLLAFRDAQNKNTLLAVERIDLCASSPD